MNGDLVTERAVLIEFPSNEALKKFWLNSRYGLEDATVVETAAEQRTWIVLVLTFGSHLSGN